MALIFDTNALSAFANGYDCAQRYAEIRRELKSAGTPIPTNDLWIAALARQHQLQIVTRDAHFRAVRGLRILAW